MKNDLIAQILKRPFLRFLLAGGVNALFSYCCFAVLMWLLQNKELAVTLNLIISIFFNYNTARLFVFHSANKLSKIFKFYLVYFLTYPVNLLHLYITVDIWQWNVYFSQFVTLLYFPLLSYILQKKLVFKDKSVTEINKVAQKRD